MGNADTRSYLCKVYGTAVLVFFPDAPETFSSVLISPHVIPRGTRDADGGLAGRFSVRRSRPARRRMPPHR